MAADQNETSSVSLEDQSLSEQLDPQADEQLANDWKEMTKSGGVSENRDTPSGQATSHKGVTAFLNNGSVPYERLPMLEVVFDRLVRMMTTSLRNFTSDNVEVSLEQITSTRIGDYIDELPVPSMINVVKAEEWDNYALLTVNNSLIYTIVDVLLGGRQGASVLTIENRPYTTIERKLVERMAQIILTDLSAAFDPVSSIKFRFERLETNPRFALISRASNTATLATFKIDMDGRGGMIQILIPSATLEPVRELLLQMFLGEKFGRDSIWENHLAQELWHTNVDIKATLDTVTVPLKTLLNWKVGSELLLTATPTSLIEVSCGDIVLFSGKMGRRNGNISVKIETSKIKK